MNLEKAQLDMNKTSHTFHIPVMGTGFTLDSPIRIAKYGISTVISLVDDVLIEQMRKVLCEKYDEDYTEITDSDSDPRANRIMTYLNMINQLVKNQIKTLQDSDFSEGSDIVRYFTMLPDNCQAKKLYIEMSGCTDPAKKEEIQNLLRSMIVPGDIDVNIMTKLDTATYAAGEKRPDEFNSAMSALRGFAKSNLSSAIVFSAGFNQRLYSYCAKFKDFFQDENGNLKKKIILKVSDYRSALIQGKFLAKRGLWVSEFRIESGINCGGHTFPGKGNLLGPVMEEFKKKKEYLVSTLHVLYNKALISLNNKTTTEPHSLKITVQGGIGTAEEDRLLMEYYEMDGTGWATPFMLTPEVVDMDSEHFEKLLHAEDDDVYLSDSSPVGVPFWNLYSSASENSRRKRIEAGKPGSLCRKRFLNFNSEFEGKPVCVASASYQKRKLAQIEENEFDPTRKELLRESVIVKSCICHDLGGSLVRQNHLNSDAEPAICCGPNIINFSKETTLDSMIDHIYGRTSLLTNSARPHMFIKELELYIRHFSNELEKFKQDMSENAPEYFIDFKKNLTAAIEYYKNSACDIIKNGSELFLAQLDELNERLERIPLIDLTVECTSA